MSPIATHIPTAYRNIIDPLVAKARTFLKLGETLQPIAFVGNFSRQILQHVLMNNETIEAKDASCDLIARVAEQMEADFIFIITEAWALREDKVHRMQQIIAEYGSIGACPYRVDSATFSLESRHGAWFGQANIKPRGVSRKKRTFGEVKFQFFTEAQGRFWICCPELQRRPRPAPCIEARGQNAGLSSWGNQLNRDSAASWALSLR